MSHAVLQSWPKTSRLDYLLPKLHKCEALKSKFPLTYIPKIKLHGANTGIQVNPFTTPTVIAQSRNRLLLKYDFYGFGEFVESIKKLLPIKENAYTIFGEWCGPKIHKGTAVNQLPHRIYAVFAIKMQMIDSDSNSDSDSDSDSVSDNNSTNYYVTDPVQIAEYINAAEIPNLYVIPFEDVSIQLDPFCLKEDTIKQIEELTELLEERDPWIEKTFGVTGRGEGYVFYPVNTAIGIDYLFKAKNSKFDQVKTKKESKSKPKISASDLAFINSFVDKTVTEARLNQALRETGSIRGDVTMLGLFLKWVSEDIAMEHKRKLKELNLPWKQISRVMTLRTKTWFLANT